MRNNLVVIEGTKFIYKTNFSGDPTRDKYGDTHRKCNLIIPDIDLARQLIDEGFNVKLTKPKPGEEEGFIPRYYVAVKLNYDSKWPPQVYLMTGENDDGIPLDAESIDNVDYMWVENVNAVLNKYKGENGNSLWVRSMEVYQKMDDDPIRMRHSMANQNRSDEATDMSFN